MGAYLFVGGHVFDGRRRREGLAVATRDERIVAVGTSEDVRRAAGPAEVIDLRGGLLLPGFQDAHMHPLVGGLERLRCELTGLDGPEDYLRAIGTSAASGPATGWVRGGGWSIAACCVRVRWRWRSGTSRPAARRTPPRCARRRPTCTAGGSRAGTTP